MCNTLKARTKDAHTVCGGPALKDVERFPKNPVFELYDRCLYERTFMSEVIENRATSKLSNFHPNNHECKHRRRLRRDREPSRIQIRSLKSPFSYASKNWQLL